MSLCRAPRPSSWPVLDLPAGVRAYVIGLPLLAGALAVLLVRGTKPDGAELRLYALLLLAGALAVEVTRRLGEPAGTAAKDLLSAWWLPLAVLLPPAYVLLAPLPLMALMQWRVRPTLVHRRVFSAACVGLAYAAASVTLHALLPNGTSPPPRPGLLHWALLVGAVGAGAALVNCLLVAAAVHAADPQTTWTELVYAPEKLRMDAVETCLGVVVAVLVGLDPVLIAFALPPVLLLQRGLLHAQLTEDARLDAKTGLLNAPTWEREAAGKLLALRQRSQPAAVLLIDVDHFKRVNDTHGHLIGDEVLRALADVLRQGVRDGDLLGRFGGEEFVALLPAADVPETALVAERLRERVTALRVPGLEGSVVSVTVSIGVASTRFGELSVPELLAAADFCMYQAKAAGRNRVAPESLAVGA